MGSAPKWTYDQIPTLKQSLAELNRPHSVIDEQLTMLLQGLTQSVLETGTLLVLFSQWDRIPERYLAILMDSKDHRRRHNIRIHGTYYFGTQVHSVQGVPEAYRIVLKFKDSVPLFVSAQ